MTTRLEYRQAIGAQLKEFYVTGTLDAGSTSTQMVDADRTEPRETWAGATMRLQTATPEERLVRGGSPTQGFVWLDRALAAGAPATGVAYEILKGWTLTDFNDAINWACQRAYPMVFEPLDDKTTVVAVANTLEYTLTATWREINEVYEEEQGSSPTRWRKMGLGLEYDLMPSGVGFIFRLTGVDPVAGLYFRFVGRKILSITALDAATSSLPLELVTAGALAYLFKKGINPDQTALSAGFDKKAKDALVLFEEAKRIFRTARRPRRAITPLLATISDGSEIEGGW